MHSKAKNLSKITRNAAKCDPPRIPHSYLSLPHNPLFIINVQVEAKDEPDTVN